MQRITQVPPSATSYCDCAFSWDLEEKLSQGADGNGGEEGGAGKKVGPTADFFFPYFEKTYV